MIDQQSTQFPPCPSYDSRLRPLRTPAHRFVGVNAHYSASVVDHFQSFSRGSGSERSASPRGGKAGRQEAARGSLSAYSGRSAGSCRCCSALSAGLHLGVISLGS